MAHSGLTSTCQIVRQRACEGQPRGLQRSFVRVLLLLAGRIGHEFLVENGHRNRRVHERDGEAEHNEQRDVLGRREVDGSDEFVGNNHALQEEKSESRNGEEGQQGHRHDTGRRILDDNVIT